MLKIVVTVVESWDEKSEEFVVGESFDLHLEHSLVSLSKWESKFEKPFLGAGEKTNEEVMEYVKFMILDDEIPPEVFSKLSKENIEAINDYINAKSTATWFKETPQARSMEVITSELIYYWMIAFNIPFECQHWHLNRLFTLIQVCNEKNKTPKKQSSREMIAERKRLNDERRQKYNTSG